VARFLNVAQQGRRRLIAFGVVLAAMNSCFYLSIAIVPICIRDAAVAFFNPVLLAAAAGVGISSSVIPYVCDQLAMNKLPATSFSLLLSLLPAMATAMGIVVLRQFPSGPQLAGLALVAAGVALHRSEIRP
jgi:inner membrane transporter RhtA